MGRLLFSLFCLLWSLCALAKAQPPKRLTATLDRTGALTLRFAGSQRVYALLRPGVFESAWQFRTTTTGNEVGSARIRLRSVKGMVAVTYEAALEATSDRHLRLKYTLTPSVDVQVNSVHLAFLGRLDQWQQTKAIQGDKEAVIGAQPPKQAGLFSGEGPLVLIQNESKFSIETKDQPLLLQDNRAFGTQEIEVRVGKQTPEASGRLWKAGQTETFETLLSLPAPVALLREEPITLRSGEDWIPLEQPSAEIVPGSALDLSALLDAPAGKYGRIVVQSGHFGFERGTKPQRFWGVTLGAPACLLEKPDADRLVGRLARLGYNTVRLQGFESALLQSAELDKLDYLLAGLKKAGIYVSTDLTFIQPRSEGIPPGQFPAAVLLSDTTFATWKEQARLLLTHVNPYTQLAWKDDPVLGWLAVQNESNLASELSRLSPTLQGLLENEWQAWRKGRSLAESPLPKTLSNDRLGRELGAFLAELHARGFARMKAVVRELGCKALLTDINGRVDHPALLAARKGLDFVDTHFTWDAPQFLEEEGTTPSSGRNDGDAALQSGGAGPDGVAMSRLFGKPFTVSAFQYTAPNRHRSEAGFLLGAAAALQDWDGVWQTSYAQTREAALSPGALTYTELANDPLALLSSRVGTLLFLRGDAREAPNALSRHLQRDALLSQLEQPTPVGFGELVFVTRVGTWVEELTSPLAPPRPTELRLTRGGAKEGLAQLFQTDRLSANNRTNLETQERQSETGEFILNGQFGSLKLVTPRFLGGICPDGDAIKCGPLTLSAEQGEATVYVTSLDGKPVAESSRLLVAHATDLQNTGTRYATRELTILESWGALPHLVKRGTAGVTLQRKLPGKVEAWRLDTTGKRLAPLAATLKGTELSLSLSTLGDDGKATIYYEVIIK